MKQVVIEEIYQASVEVLWQALTDPDEMRKWYFDLKEFKAEIGFEFQFEGQGVKGATYMHLCKVTEVILHQRLQYSWEYQDQPGYSLVTFDLKAEGDTTRLILTHSGLESFPQDNADFDGKNFQAGWTELLKKWLANYVVNIYSNKDN